MQITLVNTGKRYNRDWIFRKVEYKFQAGNRYAITGPNGSGKSTLLQAIAGAIHLSEGQCTWHTTSGKSLEPDQLYRHFSLAAPYLELIEEMTAKEFLQFHASFKPMLTTVTIDEILAIVGLENAKQKQIRYYSSGMKQRVKLAQAVFSEVPVLLLDEPCTNLDAHGYALYKQLIDTWCTGKTIIVSSNDEQEYGFCTERISILDYK